MASPIKSYNLKELGILYEETPKTIKAWLKPHEDRIGIRLGKKFTPNQVRIIFDILGLPKKDVD